MLTNLEELVKRIKEQIDHDFDYRKPDNAIPNNFKDHPLAEKINQHTAVVRSSKGSDQFIYIPNQWFLLGYYLRELPPILREYKKHFEEIFKELNAEGKKDLTEKARDTHMLKDEDTNRIKGYFTDDTDQNLFINWLTKYDLWSGGKAISRPNDFIDSALLKIARVPAASQDFLIDLIDYINDTPELEQELSVIAQTSASKPFNTSVDQKNLYAAWNSDLITAEYSMPTLFPLLDIQEPDSLDKRFVLSMKAKRFVILTGLSGSGKTKIAQAFAYWIGEGNVSAFLQRGQQIQGDSNEKYYEVVDVDRTSVTFASNLNNELVETVLPKKLIELWAKYIADNKLDRTVSSEALKEPTELLSNLSTIYSSSHSLLKAAAFALIETQRNVLAISPYLVIAVGADWTNRDPIFGYSDVLNNKYHTEPALELILQAIDYPKIPHFLILDEMNMSHVERYFADVLSAIESGEEILLHDGSLATHIPPRISLPSNLFIVGTVNVDETTYMFSPKVLDRANVLEFRATSDAIQAFVSGQNTINVEFLRGRGKNFGTSFVEDASRKVTLPSLIRKPFQEEIKKIYDTLSEHGMEFGFRSAYEIERYVTYHFEASGQNEAEYTQLTFLKAFDSQIMQKLLPRLNGSRRKLEPILLSLIELCGEIRHSSDVDESSGDIQKTIPSSRYDVLTAIDTTETLRSKLRNIKYPLSYEKLTRMLKRLEDGFTSFTEA